MARKFLIRKRATRRRRIRFRTLKIKTLNVVCEKKFAMFGCWGVDCKPGSAQSMIARDINDQDDIEFMVTAGDNFYVETPEEINFETNVVNCYNKPMYAALGNHDVLFYDVESTFQNPNWILPDKNYIINIVTKRGTPRLRILMINTNPIYEREFYTKRGIIDQIQADKRQLEAFLDNVPPSDLFTICVGHHPLLTNRHKPKGAPMEFTNFARRIASMCNMYVCADEHNLQHIIYENLNEFILGGGGANPDENIIVDFPNETKFQHPFHGYGIFDVRKLKMTLRCLDKETRDIKKCYKYKF